MDHVRQMTETHSIITGLRHTDVMTNVRGWKALTRAADAAAPHLGELRALLVSMPAGDVTPYRAPRVAARSRPPRHP